MKKWWIKQGKPSLKVFSNTKPDSIEKDEHQIMAEMLAVLLDDNTSVKNLRDLADSIESGRKPLKPAVDKYRAWLWLQLKSPYRKIATQKFSEIRILFDKEFLNNTIEDSTLRTMIKKDLQVILMPDKKGPRGPRIR
jgi:hypothetical protein